MKEHFCVRKAPCAVLVLVVATMSWAPEARGAIVEPDAVFYGTAVVDGRPLGAGRKVLGRMGTEVLATYTMGEDPAAGDWYVLRIPLVHLIDGEPLPAGSATVGPPYNVVTFEVNGEAAGSATITDRGMLALRNLGAGGCGDGTLEPPGEECDDGNTIAGDCCSPTCQYEASGSACTDDGNVCTDNTCDGAGTCQATNNAQPCDDGLFCNGADTCSGGGCAVHTGDPCAGPDGDGDCSESCSEAADNCTGADPNGSVCDDGLFCNAADTCGGGGCTAHSGDPCAGPDGDGDCSESCNEAADSCTGPDPNGSACSDGQFCNGADTCSGGTCGAHSGDPCPADQVCIEDKDVCEAPTCGNGVKDPGETCGEPGLVICPPGKGCVECTCEDCVDVAVECSDPASAGEQFTAEIRIDGLVRQAYAISLTWKPDELDLVSIGQSGVPEPEATCDSDNEEGRAECSGLQYVHQGGGAEEEIFAPVSVVLESKSAGQGCEGLVVAGLSDVAAHPIPVCPGPCAKDDDCEDEDLCNGDERCAESECIAGGPLVCDDGDACNGIETCASSSGCQSGTPPVCDDGDVCNGVETCAPDAGCQSGVPLTCDDGVECTDDSCDPATGCRHVASDASCDDGNACTRDFCDPNTGGCVREAPVGFGGARCMADRLLEPDVCGAEEIHPGLTKTIGKKAEKATRFLDKAEAASGKKKAARFLREAKRQLYQLNKRINRTARKKKISEACRLTLDGLVSEARGVMAPLGST